MINELNTTIMYEVKRTIETMHVEGNVYAYQDQTWVDNKLIETIEGLAFKEELDKFRKQEPIQTADAFRLCKGNTRELFRTHHWGEAMDKVYREDIVIERPYTYLEQHGKEEATLLNLHAQKDGHTYDVWGEKIPCAYYFDYIEAEMHNGCYDLDELLTILENRNDIIFKKKGIQRIPYYNATEEQTHYLEFVWTPSDEDFQQVKDIRMKRNVLAYVKEHIFNFPKANYTE